MNAKRFLWALAAMVSAWTSSADVISLDGTIYATDTGSTVDWITFTLDAEAIVTFDVLAYEHDGADYVDLTGASGSTGFDSYILLFTGANPASEGDFIDEGDDYSPGLDTNGSVFASDSYLATVLPAGTYTIAIGSYYLGESEARDQANDDGLDDYYGYFYESLAADYRLDLITEGGNISGISINGELVSGPVEDPVAEPATISLVGLGLAGLGYRRRKAA